MAKKIVILKGSPREQGNSSTLADQTRKGAEAEGAEVASFFLHGMDIKPCDACEGCRAAQSCILGDDMERIYPKLIEADAIVLASPVYWFTFTAQLKLCIDRWYALFNQNPRAFEGKKFGIILTFGGSDLQDSGGVNAMYTYQSMCHYLRAEIAGIVCGSLSDVGDAQKNPELMLEAENLGRLLAR